MKRGVRNFVQTTLFLSVLGITVNAQPVIIKDVPNNSTNFVEAGDLVYFFSGEDLWRTDGTTEGTILLKNVSAVGASGFAEFKGMAFFYSSGALWRSDGTSAGTIPFTASALTNIQLLAITDSYLFFTALNPATGSELYRTDGTTSGTVMIKDVNPGIDSGFKRALAVVGNHFFFAGNDGVNGTEPWKTDGTAQGTVMIKDINPGAADGFGDTNPFSFWNAFSFNDRFYFTGYTEEHGLEPWVSDGTEQGTHILKDIVSGQESPDRIQFVIAHNGFLYFLVFNNLTTFESGPADLWKTSGSTSSTTRIQTLGAEQMDHDYHSFLVYHDKVYFFDRTNFFSDNLWVTDGTAGGTNTFFDLITIDGSISFFDVVNDYLLFTATFEGTPTGFYRSDGTATGTEVFTQFKSGSYLRFPRGITKVGDFVFYADHDGIADMGHAFSEEDYYHLYQSNGITSQSIRTLWGINTIGSNNITGLKGQVIFTTQNDQFGSVDDQMRLWKYDPSVQPPPVAHFTLVDAGADEDLRRLTDSASITTDVPLNIRYNPVEKPGSVVFELNGEAIRTDSTEPFSFAGDTNGDYAPWQEAKGGTYQLTAIPYSQSGGQGTAGEALTITFTIKCEEGEGCIVSGSILRELWNGVPGNHVSAIPVDTPPDVRRGLGKFESPANSGLNYGARIRGFILPPVSGNYTFWISSDDHSELWLSTDDKPAGKRKIATIRGFTHARQWDKFPSQRSSAIPLEAGKKYYIEALHKQGTGADNLAVGWQLPGGRMERPIPGNRLSSFSPGDITGPTVTLISPVEGQVFTASVDSILIEAEAADGDDGTITLVEFFAGPTQERIVKIGEDVTLPFSFVWENVVAGNYILFANAYDAEGNSTTSSRVNVTVEGTGCTTTGTITREFWTGVPRPRVSDIPLESAPSGTQTLTIFEGPTNIGINYGARIRGYICPPITGEYTFWIASNDHSELWLSILDDDPLNITRIAWLDRATGPREWDKFPSQLSAPIWLTQGQRYYVEALHKQGIGTDHIAVGWQLPDGTIERPIPGNRLSPLEIDSAITISDSGMEPEDTFLYSQINIYPNPAQSSDVQLTISGYEDIDETIETLVEIVNMTGKVLLSQKVSCGGDCNTYLMNIEKQLVPGIYLVNLKTKGARYSKRLLVK